jgi:hypothetical protein
MFLNADNMETVIYLLIVNVIGLWLIVFYLKWWISELTSETLNAVKGQYEINVGLFTGTRKTP